MRVEVDSCQVKYDLGVGGYDTEELLLVGISEFDGYDNVEGEMGISIQY